MPLRESRVHYLPGWNDAICEARRLCGLRAGPPDVLAAFLRQRQREFLNACSQAFESLVDAGTPRALFAYACSCALTHHQTEPEHFWPRWGPMVGPMTPRGSGYYWPVYHPWHPGEGAWAGWDGCEPPCAFAGLWPPLSLVGEYRYAMPDGRRRTGASLLAEAVKRQLGESITWLMLPSDVLWTVGIGQQPKLADDLGRSGLQIVRVETGQVVTRAINPVPALAFLTSDNPPRPYKCSVDLTAVEGPVVPCLPKLQLETAWADSEDRALAERWEKVARFIVARAGLGQSTPILESGRPQGSAAMNPPAPGQTRSDWIRETFLKLLRGKGAAASNLRVRERLHDMVRERARREHFSGGSGDPLPPGWWRKP